MLRESWKSSPGWSVLRCEANGATDPDTRWVKARQWLFIIKSFVTFYLVLVLRNKSRTPQTECKLAFVVLPSGIISRCLVIRQTSAGKIYLHNEICYFHILWKVLLQVPVFLLLRWLGKGVFYHLDSSIESPDVESSNYKGTFKKYQQMTWKCNMCCELS